MFEGGRSACRFQDSISSALSPIPVFCLCTVVGTNLCVPRSLQVKGKGIRGLGRVTDKEAHTARPINIIFQR
jgi:hypothetical protein